MAGYDAGQGLLGRRQFAVLGYGLALGTPAQARTETFWYMLKSLFCPFFTSRSFVFTMSVIQVLVFAIEVFYDYDSAALLTPKVTTLVELGARDSNLIRAGELWRLLTPVLLHANLSHLVFNLIMQMVVGFRLEPTVGLRDTMLVYIGASVGGCLFSSVISPFSISVGASAGILGIAAAIVGWVWMNWDALEGDPNRAVTLFWVIIILIFTLLAGVV